MRADQSLQLTPPRVFSLLVWDIVGNKLELVLPSAGASRKWGGTVVLGIISIPPLWAAALLSTYLEFSRRVLLFRDSVSLCPHVH